MTDENEVPKIPMSIENKIRELEARKAELEMKHGALRRDYGAARLDQDMNVPGSKARAAEIDHEMRAVKLEIDDVTDMLSAARPRVVEAQNQQRQASVSEAGRDVRANCSAAQREADDLVPLLRDISRRLARVDQFCLQAFMAAFPHLSQDMRMLLAPQPLHSDLAEQLRIATGDGPHSLTKMVAAQNGMLLSRAPATLADEPRAA